MIGKGHANKEIAERLGVGAKTIATYKARLMEKLGLSSTPELVDKAKEWARP